MNSTIIISFFVTIISAFLGGFFAFLVSKNQIKKMLLIHDKEHLRRNIIIPLNNWIVEMSVLFKNEEKYLQTGLEGSQEKQFFFLNSKKPTQKLKLLSSLFSVNFNSYLDRIQKHLNNDEINKANIVFTEFSDIITEIHASSFD